MNEKLGFDCCQVLMNAANKAELDEAMRVVNDFYRIMNDRFRILEVNDGKQQVLGDG